jgi:hypothetical protein
MDIEAIGLHPAILLAGFAGGLCYVLSGKPSIREATSNLVVATLTTNYSYELGSRWLGAGTGIGLAAFATGVAAPMIIRFFIQRAAKFSLNGEDK